MAMAVMIQFAIEGKKPLDGSDCQVFGFADANTLSDQLALYALQNNQWAEVVTLLNEKLNDADWRAKNTIDVF